MDTWLSVTLYNLFIEKIHRKEKNKSSWSNRCLSLYLKYHYKPNKYYVIIQGEYLVPEKMYIDAHRMQEGLGVSGWWWGRG